MNLKKYLPSRTEWAVVVLILLGLSLVFGIGQPTLSLAQDAPGVRITNTQGVDYKSTENKAIFRGDVVVTHPAFIMTSDELEVYLKPDSTGIDRAIAIGHVTIRKTSSVQGDKNYYVGKSRRAIFYGDTEIVQLTDWPQIQRNNGLMIAESRDTVMTLNEAGELQVDGPVRTVVPRSQTAASN